MADTKDGYIFWFRSWNVLDDGIFKGKQSLDSRVLIQLPTNPASTPHSFLFYWDIAHIRLSSWHILKKVITSGSPP